MSGRQVNKSEFDAWIAAYPGKLEPLWWGTMDSTAYHDNERYPPNGGGWRPEGIVATIREYIGPPTYYVHDDMLAKALEGKK